MNLGSFTLAWAVVPMTLAMVGYLLVATGARQYRLGSRVLYDILLGLVGISFVYLLILFLTDKFQYSYVASYSSRDLTNTFPHFFKLSALWAGQQGTFVLWLVYGLILGLWVRSRARENEGWVMFFYIMAQAFLLILALVSKPFARLDFVPTDGQGLNPLLQNYWMQIHPPIVFLGFAAACIPFAFAMAALATNKYNDWVKQTMPWAVLSVVTLGLGIFLGGYWAYETLGWGGYWSWDPVENASVIPWFVGIALVHGMVVEKARGSWRRMNLFLAIALFLLIVYGTFLTRSGVLADFSVHSFTDLGYNNILWISLITLAAVSLGLWGYRARKIKGAAPGNDILSQEFTTFLAVALLLPFTLLVLFWTSFPLISTLFSKLPLLSKLTPTPAAIATSYYNMAGLIFSVIFALILGFNSLLVWKKTETIVFFNKIIIPFAASAFGSLIILLLGLKRIVELWSAPSPPGVSLKVAFIIILYFFFFLASLFALITNVTNLIQRNGNWRTLGGYLSHVGFAILLLGIIISSSFGEKTKLNVEKDSSGMALGYNIKYGGTEKVKTREQQSNFELSRNGDTIQAHSISKEMNRGGETQYVRTPFIKKYLFSDLYVSLENLTDESDFSMLPFDLGPAQSTTIGGYTFTFLKFDSNENKERLARAQPKTYQIAKSQSIDIDNRKITFLKFDMSQHGEGMMSKVGALLDIEFDGRHSQLIPTYEPGTNGMMRQSDPVDLPGGGTVSLDAIIADKGAIGLSYTPDEKMPDVKLGTVLSVSTDTSSYTVNPVFDAGSAHGMESMVSLPDGGRLFLVAVNARTDSASYVLVPGMPTSSATIEVSTKPMINLVWFGFLIIVIGSGLAVIRRMKESKQGALSKQE